MFKELIDVKEQKLLNIDEYLINLLLYDNTTKKNIIWATDYYCKNGKNFSFKDNILVENITGNNKNIIRPRIKKTKIEQFQRIKDKAEVFTPAWICNKQNNIIDENWFGYANVFNYERDKVWIVNEKKIEFKNGKTWKDYLKEKRLEISCGEAPYLVSRYDSVSGEIIEVYNRIGLLDRKFRVLNENVDDYNEWIDWSYIVMKSIFGYEWQGDNLLIARENILYTYIDNYKYKFKKNPDLELVEKIAKIISWNIFQMDGVKFVIPNSCKNDKIIMEQLSFFGNFCKNIKQCYGCKKNIKNKHNGIYAKIMNWDTNKVIKFISVIK